MTLHFGIVAIKRGLAVFGTSTMIGDSKGNLPNFTWWTLYSFPINETLAFVYGSSLASLLKCLGACSISPNDFRHSTLIMPPLTSWTSVVNTNHCSFSALKLRVTNLLVNSLRYFLSSSKGLQCSPSDWAIRYCNWVLISKWCSSLVRVVFWGGCAIF